MRIWDINPGYLNRQSLLGDHRELHGIVSIQQRARDGNEPYLLQSTALGELGVWL